jgi:hypothetical protein
MANPLTQLADIRRKLAKMKPSHPYFDVYPLMAPVIAAMVEGRPFSWLPSKREISAEEEQGIERILRDLDGVAERLGDDAATSLRAEVERKRAANLRAIEREEARRTAVRERSERASSGKLRRRQRPDIYRCGARRFFRPSSISAVPGTQYAFLELRLAVTKAAAHT